jgi:hypothetical protein
VRESVRRQGSGGVQARVFIGNGELHMNLWCAALGTKRSPIFDGCATLFAGMIHLIEASAEQTAEQPRRAGYANMGQI